MNRTIHAPRRALRRPAILLAAGFHLLAALTGRAQEPEPPKPERDPRSHALLDYDCKSDLARRRVTLFANGTLRLREGRPGEEAVRLVELGTEDVAFYVEAMREAGSAELEVAGDEPTGEWIDHCWLTLDIPGDEAATFEFGPHGTLSARLSHLVALSRQLGERVQAAGQGKRHLPIRYKPKRGDVLERADGLLFRVEGLSDDGRAVELVGIDTPYVVYTPLETLTQEYVALVEREKSDRR